MIEALNAAEHTGRIASAVPVAASLFQPSPALLVFRNYSLTAPTTARLAFRNMDSVPRRMGVLPCESPVFRVSAPHTARGAPLTDSRLAPGMEVFYTITFSPRALSDYAYDLICVTEREKFLVPLRALGPRGVLSFPDSLAFPPTPVKTTSTSTIVVRNTGTRATEYALRPPAQWAASPAQGVVEVGGHVAVTLAFHPLAAGGLVREEMEVAFPGSGTSAYVALSGEGVDVAAALSAPVLTFPATYLGLTARHSVTLTNDSDTPLEYSWMAAAREGAGSSSSGPSSSDTAARPFAFTVGGGGLDGARSSDSAWAAFLEPGATASLVEMGEEQLGGSGSSSMASVAPPQEQQPQPAAAAGRAFSHANFSISPASGTVWSRASVTFEVVFSPTAKASLFTTAFLECAGRSARLPLALEGQGLGPNLTLLFDTVPMGTVTATARHKYLVQLMNRGDAPGVWQLTPSGPGRGGAWAECFAFDPPAGTLAPGDSVVVTAAFCSHALGEVAQGFLVRMQGTEDTLGLRFEGTVAPPALLADVDSLHFGASPFGFPLARRLSLLNTSSVPVTFALRIPADGASVPVGSYREGMKALAAGARRRTAGLTDTPLELEARTEFSLLPSTGTIAPGGSMEVQCTLTSFSTGRDYRQEGFELLVDLPGLLPALLRLPIEAACAVPPLDPSATELGYGDLFIRHTYSRTLTLTNSSAILPARFLCDPQDAHSTGLAVLAVHPDSGTVPAGGSVALTVSITPLRLAPLSLPLYITLLGDWDGEPLRIMCSARGMGPRVRVSPAAADFGALPCLQPATLTLELHNDSDIAAPLCYHLRSGRVFALAPAEVTLPPGGRHSLTLTATLDDTGVHEDEVMIDVAEAGSLVVPVAARGKGATLWGVWRDAGGEQRWSGTDFSQLHLGTVFTRAPGHGTLTLENRGRRALTLDCSNLSLRHALLEYKKAGGPGGGGPILGGAPPPPPPLPLQQSPPSSSSSQGPAACLLCMAPAQWQGRAGRPGSCGPSMRGRWAALWQRSQRWWQCLRPPAWPLPQQRGWPLPTATTLPGMCQRQGS